MELYVNGFLNADLLKKEKWLYYLCITNNNATNIERVSSIKEITGKETLYYVLKTLDILENMKYELSEYAYMITKTVLQWSEVAKGGTRKQRDIWINKGYPLDIHNIASAKIYLENSDNNIKDTKIIYTLIKTHGIMGQNIRGEVSITKNNDIKELFNIIDKKELEDILYALNKCIIKGVNDALWETTKSSITSIINHLLYNKELNINLDNRLKNLYPNYNVSQTEYSLFFENEIFPYFELWYFTPALMDFSLNEIKQILEKVLKTPNINKTTHLNFKPLADSLYYDYENKKHINIYKKRIIEKYLEDSNNDHVSLNMNFSNNTLYIGFSFSPACEKLIDFCVEAERSGILSYEKSITMLFDMFGFRKDEFDRLNNEHKYLATMNDTNTSTKNSIIDYATGDIIVDVGSGGGVLLDLLEKTYPEKDIIGTDISSNVIDILNKKREMEKHSWEVIKHNFVEKELVLIEDNPTTIIFSSILHEIFSYTETPNGCFEIDSIKKALINAYNSLEAGGRIIIRDGVKTNSDETLTIKFNSQNGFDFFKNYMEDFKGLKEIPMEKKIVEIKNINGNHIVTGDINYMREFLYTYTWGNESYAHEVNEQFGYFTLDEYKKFFESIGAKIIVAKEFLEKGYEDHLSPLVEFQDGKWFPNSNCIIVIEKQ